MQTLAPKDFYNLAQGQSTYGMWEYILVLDDLFYNLWMHCSEPTGLGLGLGLGIMATTALTKFVTVPSIMYGQIMGIKMSLLRPDMDESQ